MGFYDNHERVALDEMKVNRIILVVAQAQAAQRSRCAILSCSKVFSHLLSILLPMAIPHIPLYQPSTLS